MESILIKTYIKMALLYFRPKYSITHNTRGPKYPASAIHQWIFTSPSSTATSPASPTISTAARNVIANKPWFSGRFPHRF
jgi:hypothetical protein